MIFKEKRANQDVYKCAIRAASRIPILCGEAGRRITQTVVQVRWRRPGDGWFKLNADGSALGNPGRANGGGLIRDSNGGRIRGFTCNIGVASSVEAELWALDCRALINQVSQVRMMHCFCEANKCARTARKEPSLQQDFVVFDSPLADISMLLYYDQIGMYYERIRLQTVGFLG
nr:putative ribonuclease h protein [Quercus suber]